MTKKVFLLGWLWCLVLSVTMGQDKIIVMHIQFGSVPSGNTEVSPAILRYNKEFAFSFTFDDSYVDAYSLGYKLLGGGQSTESGTTYPGLFSTDGCGNPVPFRADIAWITANSSNVDLHNGTAGSISYAQSIELYHSGWNFLNHSYNHEANTGSIDYRWQLLTNRERFLANTSIDMHYCVPPSGDTNYIAPAFSIGNTACFSSDYGAAGEKEVIDATLPVNMTRPVFFRKSRNSDNDTFASLKAAVESKLASAGPGKQIWWNEFTHHILAERYSGSLEFDVFRQYFEYLEDQYGIKGKDNGWVTGPIEVFEYMVVRDKVLIHKEINGSELIVTLDFSNVPGNFRYYDLSLLIRGATGVQNITIDGPCEVTHAQTVNGLLVNLDIPDSCFAGTGPVVNPSTTPVRGYPNPTDGLYFLKIPEDCTDPLVRVYNGASVLLPAPVLSVGMGIISMNLDPDVYPSGLYYITVYSKGMLIGFTRLIRY